MLVESLQGKRILLGVTGSIAAIKSPSIARELRRMGAEVTVSLTGNALQFVSAEDMEEASANPIISEIFRSNSASSIERASATLSARTIGPRADTWHVHLARSADAMLIAPCSASTIGKLRIGIYDNAVTLLAASLPRGTPLVLVPAMDEDMWHQPAVQESLAWLRKQGTFVIGPVSGALASGLAGMGRMVEPSDIVRRLCDILGDWDVRSTALRGKRVLITGGPTYEPIDAVRFIGNRSSGKMAAALAEAARAMGADVTLIMGPSVIGTNGTVQRIDVETAEEMLNAVRAEFSKADILIMAAAVADFAPANVSNTKLKKQEMERLPFASPQSYTIELRPTPDILSEIARTKRKDQIVVGFALEKGEKATDYARSKLKEKNLDMIVLNNIADEGAGFSYDTNKVTIFTRDGTSESLPLLSKEECAISILEHIQELYSRSSD